MNAISPNRVFPFKRNLTVSALHVPCGMTMVPTHIGQGSLEAAGITAFKVSNPNPFWVWYAGWRDGQPVPTVAGNGHFLAPGATDLNTSQLPDYIAAVASDEINFPITDSNGAFLYATRNPRLVFVFGSGM